MPLSVPMREVLSLEDTETMQLRITGYEFKEVSFPQMYTVPPRIMYAMKIQYDLKDGHPEIGSYWLDSKRCMAALKPLLDQTMGMPGTYSITKYGLPPQSQYVVAKVAGDLLP